MCSRGKYRLVVSKRKFWNPKKWFRKKQKANDDIVVQDHRDIDGIRSRSTSELSVDEEPIRSHDVRNSSSMHPGLSVSHDSVFHPLNSGSSDLELDGAQSSSSLSISQPLSDAKLQTELSSRLRLRRGRGDTSEDDEGLPRSPLCGSPAAATDSYLILEKTANKDLPTKSHSTCSDGSLLSMDSSEMDEDSLGLQSRHSSKVSLHEKRTDPDSELELGPSFSTTPLNHSAAHHRISVRPKRTYGAPRRKKGPPLSSALPATPEVNEESSTRSISPEGVSRDQITELYSTAGTTNSALTASNSGLTEIKLKSSSLPAGVMLSSSESFRLKRNKINSGRSQDDASLYEEEREEKLSLFERIFPRRSGKKKRKDEKIKEDAAKNEEKTVQIIPVPSVISKTYKEASSCSVTTSYSHTKRDETKPVPAPRMGAAARQRIQPIDIPETPKDPPLSPDRSFGTSPIQAELENIFRQRQLSHATLNTPPQSPKSPRFSSVISKSEFTSLSTARSSHTETKREMMPRTTTEDIRKKIKIAKLSPLQQRVIDLNRDDGFKSLTELSSKPGKPLAKSRSFKSSEDGAESDATKLVTKAASLDSVKHLDDDFASEPPINVEEEEHAIDVVEIRQETIETDVKVAEARSKVFEQDVEMKNAVTISGPSHTAIVNVKSADDDVVETENATKIVQTVTKIHLTHAVVPEFLSKQLNKVEVWPSSNIIFSMKSPKAPEEQSRPKTLFNFQADDPDIKKPPWSLGRSVSKEEETVKKIDARAYSRKSSSVSIMADSPVTEKPLDKSRSASLDSLKSNSSGITEKTSPDGLHKKKGANDGVVLRRKSLQRQKNEDEPELMKVFARRSLKLKDTEIDQLQEAIVDQKQRDSDKENNGSVDLPSGDEKIIEDASKQPLAVKNEEAEVQLRKSLSNNIFLAQRAVSLNPPKVTTAEYVIKKQASLNDKRRTDHWVNGRKEDSKKTSDVFGNEDDEEVEAKTANNFSQRKAEWEQRVRQANK
ncbi:uncharacterized protein LOC132704331 isoform X3 [Cylas formicarius]|uniref:uncharacterized protein LOC132704331 isoform X3 n=1 Tax=Cylas formicarius TaxID=197179 RepID=UPI002958AC77|nr:uncharacterized protein LOC132704331 isoform X3 [Cylas formicarius]